MGWIWTREAVACGVWRRLDVPVGLRIWRNRAGRLFSDLQEAGLQVTVRGFVVGLLALSFIFARKKWRTAGSGGGPGRYGRRRKRMEGE